MSFISYGFLLCFLPLTALVYAVARKTGLRNGVLAAASLVFYGCYDVAGLGCLIFSILVTYGFGWFGYRLAARHRRIGKAIYAVGVALNLLPLLVFKYAAFAVETFNCIFGGLGRAILVPEFFLPVGLSFFVFQSSTYLFELMRGRIKPEKNLMYYALFVAFFPTITSGPIQRADNLLAQIREERHTRFEDVQRGAILFMWGALLKMVLADRLNLFTTTVFSRYQEFGGFVLFAGAAAYSVQIYADFLGYSCMAIAIASLFGFSLKDNFRQPYLATNIADFWRRWHISLTSWLTDYIYIPLGGSRKGQVRRFINILCVFLISGLWHGTNWNFLAWGGVHACYQIAGHLTRPARERLSRKLLIDRESRAWRYLQRVWVFLFVTLAWVFFRSPTTADAIGFVKRIFSVWNPWVLFDGTLFTFGLSSGEWNICVIAVTALICVSVYREDTRERRYASGGMVSNVLLFMALLAAVVIFGIYGGEYSASAFIYAGF